MVYAEAIETPRPEDRLVNVVWFTIARRRYCLCRRKSTRLIEIREFVRGPALYVIDGQRPVYEIFAELREQSTSEAA